MTSDAPPAGQGARTPCRDGRRFDGLASVGSVRAERSWGTVREDYSADGNAWEFLPHDLARSTAYRWGEDGLAGICDRYQILVFALAFWNEQDPILKERAFGLTPIEGNHGEDVKEYYFYLDATPTHLHEVALQVSAARLSLPAADRREPPPARTGGGSSSCSTPVSSTKTGTST